MSDIRFDWHGNEVFDQIADRARLGVDEVNVRIETAAKPELYPGHGLLTGTLRRSLHTEPAHLDGQRVSGAVGTAPLRYALKIHALYRYLLNGYDQVKGQAVSIISRRVRNG